MLAIDWRGQGLSDRLNNSTAVGHVDDFSDYQSDIDAALTHPAVASIGGPRVLFAHSMGGCIGLRSVYERQDIAAAVFSAPMWGLNLSGIFRFLAPLLAHTGSALGLGKRPLLGQPKGFYLTREPFEGNNLTHDEPHWHYMREQIIQYPELALGSPSHRWLKEAFSEFAYFREAALPTLPVLAFLGGDESIVNPLAIRDTIQRFDNARLVEIDGARHEIWMETPDVQAQSWREIDTFLDAALS